jgi:hypothetical protein
MIICDIDNVLAHDAWRLHYIEWSRQDLFLRYHRYHKLCEHDTPANIDMLTPHWPVVLLTAQPCVYAQLRRWWLLKHNIPYDFVLHRAKHDHRGSVAVKRDMLNKLVDNGFDLSRCVVAVDDREDVLEMYAREFHLPTRHVELHHIVWERGDNDIAGVRQVNPSRTQQ